MIFSFDVKAEFRAAITPVLSVTQSFDSVLKKYISYNQC